MISSSFFDEFVRGQVKAIWGPDCVVVHKAEQHALPRGKPWPRLAGHYLITRGKEYGVIQVDRQPWSLLSALVARHMAFKGRHLVGMLPRRHLFPQRLSCCFQLVDGRAIVLIPMEDCDRNLSIADEATCRTMGACCRGRWWCVARWSPSLRARRIRASVTPRRSSSGEDCDISAPR
jgi:hypothetical protein